MLDNNEYYLKQTYFCSFSSIIVNQKLFDFKRNRLKNLKFLTKTRLFSTEKRKIAKKRRNWLTSLKQRDSY